MEEQVLIDQMIIIKAQLSVTGGQLVQIENNATQIM